MAPPLTDKERERIITLLSQGKSHAAIAEEVSRGTSTVQRVADSIGHRAGQSNLARAHEARSAYAAERRAEIARMAAEQAVQLLQGFDATQPVVASTGDGAEVLDVRPDARAQRDRAAALASLSKTILDIDRHDNRADEGAAAVDQWLRGMIGDAVGGSGA